MSVQVLERRGTLSDNWWGFALPQLAVLTIQVKNAYAARIWGFVEIFGVNSDGYCSTHLIDGDGTFNFLKLRISWSEIGRMWTFLCRSLPHGFTKYNSRELQKELDGKMFGIEHCTLVLDLEGSDAREKGRVHFVLWQFRYSAHKQWCHGIGREQAANKPLLKTIFLVMMQLFSPCKTTLTFVIRYKTRVEVVALSSFEENEEQFKEQVAYLRQ
ncbi:hypothetical protein ACH5RR_024393 [Cinchona calisaya]|uniref:Uncharacterized protein n=1 Tax=Cinchona calisaya TaxID=153742 RepID=A0ABD2YYM0_9GENT